MSLADYAKKDDVKTGYTAWKDLNDDNKKAWDEALAGYKSGISASVIYRWLQEEKNCPSLYINYLYFTVFYIQF